MEREEQLITILNFLVEGISEHDLIRLLCEDWNISRTKSRHLIGKAKSLIRDRVEIDETYEMGKIITRMESVYRFAYEKGDYRTCLSVLKSMTDILKTTSLQSGSTDPLAEIADLLEEAGE